MTAGAVASTAFIAIRSPELATDLLAYHDGYLSDARQKFCLECGVIAVKALMAKQPPHRPRGASPYRERDFAAVVLARMVLLGDNPPSVSEAIRRGVVVCKAAGKPVNCLSQGWERRLRDYLNTNTAELDAVLAAQGYPGFEFKCPPNETTYSQ